MARVSRLLQRRRRALKEVDELMDRADHVIVIHYSCESFYDRPDGSSPRITSIAVANLESEQSNSFSIHQVAEQKGYELDSIAEHYNELEQVMLDEFWEYVHGHQGYEWLTWRMYSINYGFQAIAHRSKVVGSKPISIHETNIHELSHLLHNIYGAHYIDDPKLQRLAEKNSISMNDFLPGAQEALAFDQEEYVKLHFSTLRKVQVIAAMMQQVDDRSLKTDSTWRSTYGLYPEAISEWLSEHWVVTLIGAFFAVIGVIASFIQIWEFAHK